MKRNILTTLAALATMSSVAFAGGKVVAPVVAPVEPVPAFLTPSPIYVGLGLIWGRFNGACGGSDECRYEDVTYGALLRVGYDFNRYFGVEGRGLGTFLGAQPNYGEELRHLGVYAKPMYPIGDDINVYALLGYGWTQTKTSGNNLNNINEGGLSAGIGLEYDLSDKKDDREEDTLYKNGFNGQGDQEKGWGLFVDYQRLLIKTNTPHLDVVSGGVTYDF